MTAVLSWFPDRFRPSRGRYSSLLKDRPDRSNRKSLLRNLFIAAVLITSFLLFSAFVRSPRQVPFRNSSYDWSRYTYRHPPSRLTALPTPVSRRTPRVQHRFRRESRPAAIKRLRRQQTVVNVFKKGWQSYKDHAWLKDELQPISAGSKNTFGGWAASLVDALDTMWIMGLKDDFYEAATEAAKIDWARTNDTACNMFETNIRHLGGLLAAYDLSHEHALLSKAVELGDMLHAGFDTPNNMPPFWFNFEQAKNGTMTADNHQISAAVGSFSLEFTRLSQVTGNPKYYDAIARVTSWFVQHQNSTPLPGMWPTFVNARDQVFFENTFTLGALADSLYEYLPKMYYLLGGSEPVYEKAYKDSMATAIKYLLFRPKFPNDPDILFTGSASVSGNQSYLNPEAQHLSCFTGGMFALGGKLFSLPEHVDIGAKLTQGCIHAYNATATGIMPEIFRMQPCTLAEECHWTALANTTSTGTGAFGIDRLPDGFTSITDRSYLLRPEALESVFILYRITGDPALQDAAWQMFQSIEAATATIYANAAIVDVTAPGMPVQRDSMESFWFAETLKYLYLIFSSPDVISLDDWVFNTEAHPLKRPK